MFFIFNPTILGAERYPWPFTISRKDLTQGVLLVGFYFCCCGSVEF